MNHSLNCTQPHCHAATSHNPIPTITTALSGSLAHCPWHANRLAATVRRLLSSTCSNRQAASLESAMAPTLPSMALTSSRRNKTEIHSNADGSVRGVYTCTRASISMSKARTRLRHSCRSSLLSLSVPAAARQNATGREYELPEPLRSYLSKKDLYFCDGRAHQ